MKEILTHSKRQAYKTCHRYFYHKHEQHLALRREKTGRRRGSIFGSLLFTVQQVGTLDEVESVLDVAAERLYAEIHPDDEEDARALEVEQIKVEVMALEYLLRYGIDDRREIQFDLPLRNPATGHPSTRFRDGGKIDGCVITGEKKVRIIEDKFVGQIQKAMIDRLPLDEQCSEYVAAFEAMGWQASVAYRHTLYPGINPTKEKIPPALTPSGKPSQAKHVPAETLEAFRSRLRWDIADRPEHYFDQQDLIFPTDHLDDFRRGRWGTAQEIMASRRQAKIDWQQAFPMAPSRCWEWGGCEFIPLCTKVKGAQDLYIVQGDNPELDTGGVASEYTNGQ